MKKPLDDFDLMIRGHAVVYGQKEESHSVLMRILEFLNDIFCYDTKPPSHDGYRQGTARQIRQAIPHISGSDLDRACDYLWLCRLVTKHRFLGACQYRIEPAGFDALESGTPIVFRFDPEALSEDEFERFNKEVRRREERKKHLYAGGVEWGSREYWDRYWLAHGLAEH